MKGLSVLFVLILTFLFIMSVNSTHAFSQTSRDASHDKAGAPPPQGDSPLSGTVLETMDSGGYTYIHLEKKGKKIWVATPRMKVTVGEEVSLAPGMVMHNFASKTLGRTFETIVFSRGAMGTVQKGTGKPSDHPQVKASRDTKARAIKVDKASGPDAYTVAELYEKSADLNSRSITVRGEVVKVSANIMGKNWIHLQDGSGNASKGTNDLLVTSQDLPSVGDVVTAKGTLYKDKDFGGGYKYSVVVEETSIKK